MNKLFATVALATITLGCSAMLAQAIDDKKKDQPVTENWVCKYCPEQLLWDSEIGVHFGYPTEDIYHYSNYTGIKDSQLFLSASVKNINQENGQYWITEFNNIGTDAEQLSSRYGMQGLFSIDLDFQNIPIRKFNQSSTFFTNPSSNVLRLDDAWDRGASSSDFLNSPLFTSVNLGTDWEQLALKFAYITESNFDYSFDYHRIEKNGLRESSANQYFQAVYIPIPVNSVIEDLSARIDYLNEEWFGSLMIKFSRFDNHYDSVSFANPFIGLVSGANATTLAEEPDNRAINISFNLRYTYMPRSFIKAYLSYTEMTQDQIFLPYTTNQTLLYPLPKSSLDGEINTQHLSLKVNHWLNANWSLRAKYNYRDRYNKTNMQVFRPVISDMFPAASIINIPYDLTKTTGNIDLDWRFKKGHLLSFGLKNNKMQRIFQTVRNTSEDAVSAKYRAYFNNTFQFYLTAERSTRSGTAAELVDLISVNENPLMQRFNVSEREHNRLNMQFNFTPMEQLFSAIFSVEYSEDDYDKTELGLQYSWQNNVNIDLSWLLTENSNVGLFVEREIKQTTLGGSERFSGRDWLVDNDDEAVSYGIRFSVNKLLDEKLNISGSLHVSIADTRIAINNAGYSSKLPVVESLWTVAEIKADYQYSEQFELSVTFAFHDFESHDFAIDDVVPGAAANLLTFSAMSNNYNLGYLQLSALYHF